MESEQSSKDQKTEMIPPFLLLKRLLGLGLLGLLVIIGAFFYSDLPYIGALLVLYGLVLIIMTMWILVPLAVIQYAWGEKRHGVFSHLKQINSSKSQGDSI